MRWSTASRAICCCYAGKGREGYQLVQGKKIPYDEEETVRSCARELLESRPQAL